MNLAPPVAERLLVIGAGDVVAKRILPAIVALGLSSRVDIVHDGICDVDAANDMAVTTLRLPDGTAGRAALAALLAANRDPVIIATPPQSRLAIARLVRRTDVPLVLEKPLFASRGDEEGFRSLSDDPRLFALSYYVQEKAIGWTWLCTRDPAIAPYLGTASGAPLASVAQIMEELGQLQTIEIRINEGAERSGHLDRPAWYAQLRDGIWFDMGVHVVSMAMLAAQLSTGGYRFDQASGAETTPGSGQYRLAARAGGTSIDAMFGKHFAPEARARWLRAGFAHGKVYCDFETNDCHVEHADGRADTLVPVGGATRYHTMFAQVRDFLRNGGWQNEREDRIDLQRHALAWILDTVERSG